MMNKRVSEPTSDKQRMQLKSFNGRLPQDRLTKIKYPKGADRNYMD